MKPYQAHPSHATPYQAEQDQAEQRVNPHDENKTLPLPYAAPARPNDAYNPNRLLDSLLECLKLKNDAALSRALEINPPILSKVRHARLPVGGALLIRMHEVSGLSIGELRALMGDRRSRYRVSLVNRPPLDASSGLAGLAQPTPTA